MESSIKGPSLRKLYYSIGEVAELTGVPPHVLRYWESEFPQLRPKKGRGGQRAYQDRDLRLIASIRALLYDQRFTIAGAKSKLDKVVEENDKVVILKQVRDELRELLDILDSSGRSAAR